MLFSRRVCFAFSVAATISCLYVGDPDTGETLRNLACLESAVPTTTSSPLAAHCLDVPSATGVHLASAYHARVFGEFSTPVFVPQDCNCRQSAGMALYNAEYYLYTDVHCTFSCKYPFHPHPRDTRHSCHPHFRDIVESGGLLNLSAIETGVIHIISGLWSSTSPEMKSHTRVAIETGVESFISGPVSRMAGMKSFQRVA
ncbi:hypothetical protein R3P38DRAFT_3369910, partial [Favolaschia claudopus]